MDINTAFHHWHGHQPAYSSITSHRSRALIGQTSLLTRLKENHVISIFNSHHPPHNPVRTQPWHIISGILLQDKHRRSQFHHAAFHARWWTADWGRFLCVWKSPDVGRIIGCNCSLCWMTDIRGMASGPRCIGLASTDAWTTAVVSSLLSLQFGHCVGACFIPVCQWET